jgi:hypothetical protein
MVLVLVVPLACDPVMNGKLSVILGTVSEKKMQLLQM